MIHCNFNKEKGILETKLQGKISIQEMNDYIVSIQKNKDLPSVLKIYSDATNAQFAERIGKKDLLSILELNKITLSQKKYIYDAFVISSTFETATGMMYKELNKIENYLFEVFSTKEAAMNWLSKF